MKNPSRISAVTVFLFVLSMSTFAQSIIANHTVVDEYSSIPDNWIDSVKKMLLVYCGESHGKGLLYGLESLARTESKYAAKVTWDGEPESSSNSHLRVCRTYRNLANDDWSVSAGEEDFFTSAQAVNMMLDNLEYCQTNLNNPVSAFGFGWCWDMTWLAGLDSDGWAGRLYYPVDKSEHTDHWDINTTSPSLQDYLTAVESYNSGNPNTATFYTTAPADWNTEGVGFQRYLKNQAIRDHVNANGGYLFDYADILCWNSQGIASTRTWNGNSFPYIWAWGEADYKEEYDGGQGSCHVSEEGCIRLAKAMWWLMARIAGWEESTTTKMEVKKKQSDPIASGPKGTCSVIRFEKSTRGINLGGGDDFSASITHYSMQGRALNFSCDSKSPFCTTIRDSNER